MPAKEYTVGIPIATVIFLGLIVAAFVTLGQRTPSDAELRDESALVVRELRERGAAFLPPNNDDQTGPTVYASGGETVTTVRVYGLIAPDLQRRTVAILRDIRTDLQTRPITIHFHYPREVDREDSSSPSVTPSVDEEPQPFRTVRITATLESGATPLTDEDQ